jgi:hypothetical protein
VLIALIVVLEALDWLALVFVSAELVVVELAVLAECGLQVFVAREQRTQEEPQE